MKIKGVDKSKIPTFTQHLKDIKNLGMRLVNPKKIKLQNGWTIDYIRIGGAYEGILEGGPGELANNSIIKHSDYFFKKIEGRTSEEVNVVARYKKELTKSGECILKPLKIHTLLIDGSMDKLALIVTFLDEEEELEDVLNDILSIPELIVKEFMF